MNHIGDTNKMVGDTPRMDAVAGLASGIVDAAILAEGMELERELNRACEMYRKLDIHTLNLVDRIRRLEAAGDALLWYFCPKNTGDISFLQSEAIKQWNKAKEAKL